MSGRRVRPTRAVSSLELLGVSALLIAYFFMRLHDVLALPLFVDEGFHIRAAGAALQGNLVAPGQGYLLHTWTNALLGPQPPGAPWTVRAGTILIGLAGLAALYALARGFVSRRAGFLAVALWIAVPHLVFFERMALSDPRLASLGVVAGWIAWRLVRTGRMLWAAALGVAVFLAVLMKASGILWLPLPLVAVLLAPRLSTRRRLVLGLSSYAVFAALYLPLVGFLKIRGYDYRLYLGQSGHLLGGLDAGLADRLARNIRQAWEIDLAYLGWPLLVLAVLGGVVWLWQRPRAALFALLALGMAAGAPVVFGLSLASRYLLGHTPWVLLAAACGADLIARRWRWAGLPILAGLAAWAALVAVPFQRDAWNAPVDLPVTQDDRAVYFAYDPSGYGTREIGEALRAADPLPALGLVANCQSARLAAYPLVVDCPTIRWDSAGSQATIFEQAEALAADGPIYIIGEALPYIDLSDLPQPHTVLMTVSRPDGLTSVSLYRIEQGAKRPVRASGGS